MLWVGEVVSISRGFAVNHRRVCRLYVEEKLGLRRKRGRRDGRGAPVLQGHACGGRRHLIKDVACRRVDELHCPSSGCINGAPSSESIHGHSQQRRDFLQP
jgi:hypothetical protein